MFPFIQSTKKSKKTIPTPTMTANTDCLVILGNAAACIMIFLAFPFLILDHFSPALLRRILRIRLLRLPLLALQVCFWAIAIFVCIPLFIVCAFEISAIDYSKTGVLHMFVENTHLLAGLAFGALGFLTGCYLMYLCSEGRRSAARKKFVQSKQQA